MSQCHGSGHPKSYPAKNCGFFISSLDNWTSTNYTTPQLHYNYNCNYTTQTTLHYNYNLQLQLHYTTLQLQLQLHYTTLHPAVVVRWPLQPLQPLQKRNSNHLSVHQWIRSAIHESQQPTSPIGFLFLKLPPPPCAVLLVSLYLFLRKTKRTKRTIKFATSPRYQDGPHIEKHQRTWLQLRPMIDQWFTLYLKCV